MSFYNGQDGIPAKEHICAGRNLPFTLESRKGNYQRNDIFEKLADTLHISSAEDYLGNIMRCQLSPILSNGIFFIENVGLVNPKRPTSFFLVVFEGSCPKSLYK